MNQVIPKKIHYCWFGGNPLPELAQKCIASWKKYCPDYEIIEWNESNFDINCCQYAKEAYEAKKWAFVSDVARFQILYENGGLYFDTDVEIIKPLDDIIAKGGFMGIESDKRSTPAGIGVAVNPGLGLAVAPGLGLYKDLIDRYHKRHFINEDGSLNLTTVVEYTTEALLQYGLQPKNEIQYIGGIYIYPKDYFCPKDYVSGKLELTDNSYTIHHYDGSWLSDEERYLSKLQQFFIKIFPKKLTNILATSLSIIKFHGINAYLQFCIKRINKR